MFCSLAHIYAIFLFLRFVKVRLCLWVWVCTYHAKNSSCANGKSKRMAYPNNIKIEIGSLTLPPNAAHNKYENVWQWHIWIVYMSILRLHAAVRCTARRRRRVYNTQGMACKKSKSKRECRKRNAKRKKRNERRKKRTKTCNFSEINWNMKRIHILGFDAVVVFFRVILSPSFPLVPVRPSVSSLREEAHTQYTVQSECNAAAERRVRSIHCAGFVSFFFLFFVVQLLFFVQWMCCAK